MKSVAEFDGRERVLLMDKSITRALSNLDQLFAGRLHLAETVVEGFARQSRYHSFALRNLVAEVKAFTNEKPI